MIQEECKIYWALRKKAIALCKNHSIIQKCIDNGISNVLSTVEEIKDHFEAEEVVVSENQITIIGENGIIMGHYVPLTNKLWRNEND
jgi:hypothetical protein